MNEEWIKQVKEHGQLMPGDRLLLPMHLDALVVSDTPGEVKWKNTALQLQNLNSPGSTRGLGKYLDRSAAAQPVDDPIHLPGIHLHWVLPKFFRHGIQEEQDGAPVFPLVPNRWLVIRTSLHDKKIKLKSEIVKSDFITHGSAKPNRLLLNNATDKLVPGSSSYEAVQIGEKFKFDGNWEDKNPAPLFLTIVAPGDPGFAASYSSCKGVFGYHDDMSGDPAGIYSYMVTGWYSDPSKDILYGAATVEAWLEKMKKHALTIALPEDQKGSIPLPGGVLCHASVFSVKWTGAQSRYANQQLSGVTRTGAASIGQSPLDALAPVIVKYIPEMKSRMVESVFASFQYRVLADYNSASGWEVLKKKVHSGSFHLIHAGSEWVIQRKETKEAGTQKPGILPPLPNELGVLLQQLNTLQQEYDEKMNELHALQSQLYAYWFKHTWTYTKDCLLPGNQKEAIRKKLEPFFKEASSPVRTRINELKNRITALKRKRPVLPAGEDSDGESIEKYDGDIRLQYDALQQQLDEIKKPELAQLILKETRLAPFYLAKDPSVVITGVPPSAKYTDEGAPAGRLAMHLAKTISCQKKKVLVDQLNAETATVFPRNRNIAAAIESLFNEMQLLNPDLSMPAAIVAYRQHGGSSPTQEELKQLADELVKLMHHPDAASFRTGDDLAAAVPALFAMASWTQPWTPLLLEWKAEWHTSYTSLTHEAVMKNWAFGEKQGAIPNNIDFVFRQDKPDTAKSATRNYSGRIPLTADLGKKISDVFEGDFHFLTSKDLENLQPLSQTLSGLTDNLVMREHSTQLPPLSYENNKLIVNELINDIDDQYTWNPMMEETGFFPFRGGHFKITALRVIDSFGQVAEIPPGECSVSQSMPVIRDGGATYIELPLRLTQPARLRFKWMAADKPGQETTTDPASSPVCGWLLPNKLDNSIMVFDAQGIAAGALQAAGETVRWVHAPGTAGKADIDTASLQEQVKAIVKGILATGKTAVLHQLTEQINELQKRVFAKTARQSILMALPIGYPVAIVKASCRLELKDLPAQYQGWDWETYNAALSNVKFPVFIGDARSKIDGLAGYFIQGSYQHLHLPYANGPVGDPYFTGNEGITVCVGQPATDLLLLIDPRMGVHLNCGILPESYYELPDQLINQAIEAIQPSFLASPMLGFRSGLQLPLAALPDKEWHWLTVTKKEQTTTWDQPKVLEKMVKGLLSFEPLQIKEGWLKLVNKPKKS